MKGLLNEQICPFQILPYSILCHQPIIADGTLDVAGISNFKSTVNLTQKTSTNSAILQFRADTGDSRATIYSSALDNVFRFQIQSYYNPNGFEWMIGDTGVVLMTLETNGKLTSNGSIKCNGLIDSTNSTGTSGQLPTANGSGGWAWTSSINRATGGVVMTSGSLTANSSQSFFVNIPNFVGSVSSIYVATPVCISVNGAGSKTGLINISYIAYVSNPTTSSTRVEIYCINNTSSAIGFNVNVTAVA